MKRLSILLIFLPFLSHAQMTKQDSVWLPFKALIGKWTGTSEGQPGKGKYERSYELVLNKKFIEVKNKSTYPPSKEHAKGEVHEDKGFISYDKARKTFVLRQFHVEGFVNQYKIESISQDSKTIVFISEAIETSHRVLGQGRPIKLLAIKNLSKLLNWLSRGKNLNCIPRQF